MKTNKLPKPLATALASRDPGQVSQVLAKLVASSISQDWWLRASDMLAWLLQDGTALPIDNPLSPRAKWAATPQQTEEVLGHLVPVLLPLSAKDPGMLAKIWGIVGDWARSQASTPRVADATGLVCARLLLNAIPALDRSQGQAGLDMLSDAMRVRYRTHQAFIDALTAPEALVTLSLSKVALRPMDLVIDEMPVLSLEDSPDVTPAQADRMNAQRERLSRLAAHPQGLPSVVRLDLNPIGPFTTLINGYGDTPARATWVAKTLLPYYQARRSGHADKLASLLAWQDFEAMARSLSPEQAAGFWKEHAWFTPPDGWSKACDVLLRYPASLAMQGLLDLDLDVPAARLRIECATAFMISQLAHPKLHGLEEWKDVLREVHKAWTDRAAHPNFSSDIMSKLDDLDQAERSALHDRLCLLFANPLLVVIEQELAARGHKVRPSGAALLVATSSLTHQVPAKRTSPARR